MPNVQHVLPQADGDTAPIDVDMTEPATADRVATLFAQSLRHGRSPAVYYLGELDPRTMTDAEDGAFQRKLAAHLRLGNDVTIAGGARCKAFLDDAGDIACACVFTPPPHGAGVIDAAEEDATPDALARFRHALAAIWGDDGADCQLALAVETDVAMRGLLDRRTLSIDTLCAAPRYIGSGIGKRMLRHVLRDPDATRGADHVMVGTYLNPMFWSCCGLAPMGEAIRAGDVVRKDGVVLQGIDIRLFKRRIADVMDRLARRC